MSQKRDYRDERSCRKIQSNPVLPTYDPSPSDNPVLKLKRDEYVELTQSRLQVLDHELRRLDQQAQELSTESKVLWADTRLTLGHHRRVAWDRLQDLKATASWSKLVIELDNARQDFSAAIAHARREFCLNR